MSTDGKWFFDELQKSDHFQWLISKFFSPEIVHLCHRLLCHVEVHLMRASCITGAANYLADCSLQRASAAMAFIRQTEWKFTHFKMPKQM